MTAILANHHTYSNKKRIAVYIGGISAILASTCHHISFILSTFNISESKIIYIVTLADWARPFLIVVSIFSLFVSYLYIWQSSYSHKTYNEKTKNQIKIDKIFFVFLILLVLVVLMLPYFSACVE